MKHILSKSTFLSGKQCEKRLYLGKYRRDLMPEYSAAQQFVFAQGSNIGVLACQLFPGGIDVSPENYWDFSASIAQTQQLIKAGQSVIYEAAFQFDGVLAAMDILVKTPEGWKAYEVKSATEVKDVHIEDAALQYHVMTQTGLNIKDISIIHINNQYVKNGAIDIEQLFHTASILPQVLDLQAAIPKDIERLKSVVLNKTEPQVEIGPHCDHPYACPFKEHCWKGLPEYSVFDINRLGTEVKWQLYQNGIQSISDIPEGYPLGEKQEMQVSLEKRGEKHVDKEAIDHFIADLHYPLYFLDFETYATALPVYDRSRPYEPLVFQYSLHIQSEKDAALTHKEYLAEPNPQKDIRLPLIEQLIADCGQEGDILVYNIGFERGKILAMAEQFPDHSHTLHALVKRLKDLMIPFQQRWYYTPEMRGSYSIKQVLPALLPSLSYKNLEIQKGDDASAIFSAMMAGLYKGNVEKTRTDLLAYCKMDTWAMVEILGVLTSTVLHRPR